MRNVELFNLFAARSFALLYEHFPLPKQILPEELAVDADYEGTSRDAAREVAGRTLMWLADTGYITRVGDPSVSQYRFILSPKGFEILDASPFSRIEKKEVSSDKNQVTLGERLIASTKEAVSSASKEEMKDLTKKVIGWGAAAGFAAAKTHFGF
jgi:hypothetical protein